MKKKILLFLAILFPLVLIVVYYGLYSIAEAGGWSPKCTFHEATGLQCPGCGGQRTVYYALHGNLWEAMRYNLFFIVAFPFLSFFYIRSVQVYILKQEKYLSSFVFSSAFGYTLLFVVVLFFILRNIPIAPFSYLSPPS